MKLTFGFDHNKVIGDIEITDEQVVDLLARSQNLMLGGELRINDDGTKEIVSLSLFVPPVIPNPKLVSHCEDPTCSLCRSMFG